MQCWAGELYKVDMSEISSILTPNQKTKNSLQNVSITALGNQT